MNKGLSKVLTLKPREEFQGDHIDDPVERVAVAGVAAIQLLIAERDSLRSRAKTQGQDLAALTDMNEAGYRTFTTPPQELPYANLNEKKSR